MNNDRATPAIFLEIDTAMRSGDMVRAVRLSRQALDRGHLHPVPLSLRAWWHESEGRPAAALADLLQAHATAPADPRTMTAIARCTTALSRAEEALTYLAAALVLAPASAGAWYEKGFAHEQLGELTEARAAYEKASLLAPDMTDATARLASLAARRSDWQAARALADRALAAEPDHTVALFAHVTADLAAGNFTAAERRARAVAEAPGTTPQARANGFAYLGDALDGQERHGEAYAAYAQANAGLKRLFRNRFGRGETGLALARRVVRHLAGTAAADWHAEPLPGTPVFLLGFARAGTSLLGQILASHPRVLALAEKPLLREAIEEFFNAPDGLARLQLLPVEDIMRYRTLYWRNVAREAGEAPAGRVVVDQTPLNTIHLPLIARLFPGAIIVFALRDPRDVVLSCFRRLFALNRYVYEFLSLSRTAQFYDATMQIAELAREKLPLNFHDLRNEDLVADFETRTRALCAAIGLDWDPAMAGFAGDSRARAVATPSATQIARGISAEGIGKWRHYEKEMAKVLPPLQPWVRRFGYKP